MMELFVTGLRSTYILDVPEQPCYGYALKLQIYKTEGLPVFAQRLVFAGKDVGPFTQLDSEQIRSGHSLQVYPRILGGMPATAGRVRMPHNNRMHTSASLKTHGVWKNVVKYDPYAADDGDDGAAAQARSEGAAATVDQFKGLMQLARLSGNTNHTKNRGSCLKCGMMGHMTHMCRNFLSKVDEDGDTTSDSDEADDDASGGDVQSRAPENSESPSTQGHGDRSSSKRKRKKKEKKGKKSKKKESKKKKKKKEKKKKKRRHD